MPIQKGPNEKGQGCERAAWRKAILEQDVLVVGVGHDWPGIQEYWATRDWLFCRVDGPRLTTAGPELSASCGDSLLSFHADAHQKSLADHASSVFNTTFRYVHVRSCLSRPEGQATAALEVVGAIFRPSGTSQSRLSFILSRPRQS